MELEFEKIFTLSQHRKGEYYLAQGVKRLRKKYKKVCLKPEYVLAKEAKCHLNNKCCHACDPMIKAGNLVIKSKVGFFCLSCGTDPLMV